MSTQHWDSFWQSSTSLNSFAEGSAALGYQGELLLHWRNTFATLASDATLVDIGTGNGAIALAAQEFSESNSKNFNISGVDAANINPIEVFKHNDRIASLLAKITFYAGCKTEQMPFATESVDLITSQFAFEYASQQLAIKECIRVLKPGGRLVAIMHHNKSDVSIDSQCGLKVLSLFLHKTPFFETAKHLVAVMAQVLALPGNGTLISTSQNLNKQLLQIAQQIKIDLSEPELAWFQDVMANMAKILMNFTPEHQSMFDRYYNGLIAFYARLTEQQSSALSQIDIEQLKMNFIAQGGECAISAMYVEENLFGWLCIYKK